MEASSGTGLREGMGTTTAAAGAGAMAGLLVKAIAIEGFAHQQIAHHNLELNPQLAKAARVASVVCGVSPNRFALRHRLHHRTPSIPPVNSVFKAIIDTRAAGGASGYIPNPDDPGAAYWTQDVEADPLLIKSNDGVQLRDDPWYEQFISKGGGRRLAGPILALATARFAAQLLKVEKPNQAVASFGTAAAAALAIPTIAAYAEARAGLVDGRLATDNLRGALKAKAVRHDKHHREPWIVEAGISSMDRLVIRGLLKAKLAKIPNSN